MRRPPIHVFDEWAAARDLLRIFCPDLKSRGTTIRYYDLADQIVRQEYGKPAADTRLAPLRITVSSRTPGNS